MSPADHFTKNDLERITMGVSANYDLGLLSIEPTTYQKLAERWQAKTARVKDSGATYRFLNYLSTTGVLPDTRENANKGWRKLSYIDCFLITLITKLRKFGINVDTVKLIAKVFTQPIPPEFTKHNSNIWLDVMIALHCGVDMQLFIYENGNIAFYDDTYAELHNAESTSGTLRVNLSEPLNELRKSHGLQPITIKNNDEDTKDVSSVKTSDIMTFLENSLSSMDNKTAIKIRRNTNGKYTVEQTTEKTINPKLNMFLSSMVEEDFGSINALKEGGKVVSIQTSSKRQF